MNILFKLLTWGIEIIGFSKSCKAGGKNLSAHLRSFWLTLVALRIRKNTVWYFSIKSPLIALTAIAPMLLTMKSCYSFLMIYSNELFENRLNIIQIYRTQNITLCNEKILSVEVFCLHSNVWHKSGNQKVVHTIWYKTSFFTEFHELMEK